MNLVSYDPMRVLNDLRREVNNLFSANFGDWLSNDTVPSLAAGRWMPAVDIREESERFILTADVPGVDPKDIEITMENGILTIKGERQQEQVNEGDNYRRVERQYGSFYRRFSLPDTADADRITASSKNGVLEVVIPKSEEVKPKRITVSA
jgi:HSP20 family protein